ncbi:hypothetical protein BUALT_Bualt08G0061200 [Buddleja alternifolia]|uniref:RBR-type E3 ubiquitin transferase n=1 Tax=Buddleja alternifolia TaxID=168488 RepID=A0AAV6X3K5_9LAMI|nr:hypothetical protein BUALT_Bualt08G0061200 [Buddleja alternifolia]
MEEEDYGYGSSEDEYNRVYDDDYDDGFEEESDEDPQFSGSNSSSEGYHLRISLYVIRKESLLAAQKDDMQRVMDLLSIKEHHARTLLIHHRWDVDKVISVFVERGVERLYLEAGVSVLDNTDLSSSDSLSQITCGVCFEEFPANEMTKMDCGHCFCNECWTEHFIVKINEGKSRQITCMAHKCHSICDEGQIRDLVSAKDPVLAAKFERFLLESYIEDNKRVQWCPSVPHCGNAIRVENDGYCEVECACGKQFCFSCSSEAHSPCSCLMWQLWEKKCQDESETVNWFTTNTKLCPKCSKPVNKDGGCNHVRCVCGQSFCWLCGAATGLDHNWDSIANHECGRYKDGHEQEVEQARKALWRYTHYYNRNKAHLHSLKAEEKLKEKLLQKITTLESRELETKDYSWVTNGFYRLTRSRRVLSYSYPFAYFMFGEELFKNEMTSEQRTIKQNLFEDQQQQLEMNIERLSGFLAEPFAQYPEDKVMEIRMKIITLSGVTDNLCAKLYDCIDKDLLGPLERATHIIARYRSKGVEKATELAHNLSAKTGILSLYVSPSSNIF